MEEFKGDKRTKAYREWKAKFEEEQAKKPEGLGDVVEKITTATGIKKVVKAVFGDDCGCEERRKEWNRIFKFKKPNCLEEDEYNYLKEYFSKRRDKVTFLQIKELYAIYNRVFGTKLEVSNCPSCLKNIITELSVIIDTYEK